MTTVKELSRVQVSVSGARGPSNYELWLGAGNNGTIAEYLAWVASTSGSEGFFASTAAGLAATTNGEKFWVIGTNVLDLYENDTGVAEFVAALTTNNRYSYGIYGVETTRSIVTDLNGSDVPANIGQIFIGNNTASADAITVDSSAAFPGGMATRRYRGTPGAPTAVQAGDQLGFWDFRGYYVDGAVGKFANVGSIDVLVDSNIPFSAGDVPPTYMRFSITRDNNQAQEAVRILPVGSGHGLWIGYERPDGSEDVDGPDSSITPAFYVVARDNDWVANIYAKPSSGLSNVLRLDGIGATSSDYLVAGLAGAHGAKTVKFDVRGNGEVNTAAHYKVAGTKVVGAQGAAVADATDAASAITQLNALLARCRAHGLIEA